MWYTVIWADILYIEGVVDVACNTLILSFRQLKTPYEYAGCFYIKNMLLK